MLFLLGFLLDLGLLVLVALLLLRVLRRGLPARREPRRGRGLLHRGLQPLRLVVGPLVRGLRLQARRLRLQHERLVHGGARAQGGDRRAHREERRRQRDLLEERAALVLQLFLDGLAQVFCLDFRAFGHLIPLRAGILPHGRAASAGQDAAAPTPRRVGNYRSEPVCAILPPFALSLVLTERTETERSPSTIFRTSHHHLPAARVLRTTCSTKDPYEALRWKPFLLRERLHPPRTVRALRQHRVRARHLRPRHRQLEGLRLRRDGRRRRSKGDGRPERPRQRRPRPQGERGQAPGEPRRRRRRWLRRRTQPLLVLRDQFFSTGAGVVTSAPVLF